VNVSLGMLASCSFPGIAPVLSSFLITPDCGIGINADRLHVLVLKECELGLVAKMIGMGAWQVLRVRYTMG